MIRINFGDVGYSSPCAALQFSAWAAETIILAYVMRDAYKMRD
ncbi:hypothetical protein [Thalassovita gelatinovora]|nr:hypothetical protein [Thalassovita gelatinovora]